jgi:hypothetical protein
MHKVEIINIDHRASEKRLVISYKMRYWCSDPSAPVGYQLIPNGCGYRNICGDWILMSPNIQHPEHSPTILEGKICDISKVYKYVWDYEGEFGLDPTEFESEHSYIVALALDDQSCGWQDPCVDPATCHKVPGLCDTAGDCAEGDPGTQGNCCDGFIIKIDPIDGCPYCWLDEGPGTGPTGPGTDPTGPWTVHTEDPPSTFPTQPTEPNGPHTTPGTTVGPLNVLDVFEIPTGPEGPTVDIFPFSPVPEPPGPTPVIPNQLRYKCYAAGTAQCVPTSQGGYANLHDCITSVYCSNLIEPVEGFCIDNRGVLVPDPNAVLMSFGFGSMFRDEGTCTPNNPRGEVPKPIDTGDGVYEIPDEEEPGAVAHEDLPKLGGWEGGGGNNPIPANPGRAPKVAKNLNPQLENTIGLHGGVEGNFFDSKMDSINGLLRRGAKVGRYRRSVDPEVTNYAKSTNYERLVGTNRDRGAMATHSINQSLNTKRKPILTADHGPKTAIKIVGTQAYYKSSAYLSPELFKGDLVNGRFNPISRKTQRYLTRKRNVMESRGLIRAGHEAVPIFFDEDSQQASVVKRGRPVEIPKMNIKIAPEYLNTKEVQGLAANWNLILHSRLATGYSRGVFITCAGTSKELLGNDKQFRLKLWASQGTKRISLASTQTRILGAPFKIAGIFPLGFAPGEVTIIAAIEDSNGNVQSIKHKKVDIYAEGTDHQGGLITPRSVASRNVKGALLSKLAEGDKFTFYMERSVKKLAVRLKAGRTTNVSLSAVSDAQGDSRLLHSMKLIEPLSNRVIMQNQGFLNDDKMYNWKSDKKARGAVFRGFDDGEGDIVYLSDKTMQLQISQIESTASHWTTVCLGKDLEFVPTELNVSFNNSTKVATCTGTVPLAMHELVLFSTGRKYVVRTTNSTTSTTDKNGDFSVELSNVSPGMFIGLAISTALPLASNTIEYTQVL